MNNNNNNKDNKHCYHSINGLNNLLKGASTIINTTSNRRHVATTGAGGAKTTFSIPESEISLINKTLEIVRFYISRNPELFQDPQDLLQKVEKGINIITAKTNTNNNTKGASNKNNNNNICPNKIQSLKNLLELFSIYR